MKKPSFEYSIFLLIVGLQLLPLFLVEYLVTGDGPCHLYNSRVLSDWHFHQESAFYKPFLHLNQHIEPNWLTNIVQVALLQWCTGPVAEKLFLGLYLLVFSFGFRRVVREINPESTFISSVGVLFAWNQILLFGFFNNAWSIALWFWVMAGWIKSLKQPTTQNLLVVALLLLATYLAHPVGLAVSLISVAIITLGYSFLLPKKTIFAFYKDWILRGLLVALPVLILSVHFLLRKDWSQETTETSLSGTALGLFRLSALVNYSSTERDFVTGFSIFNLGLTIYTFYLRYKLKKKYPLDGLLFLFVVLLLLVFFPPKSFSGGLEVGVRLGMFPFLALLLWSAMGTFPRWLQQSVPVIAAGFAVVFLAIRLPVQQNASKLAAEVVSCKEYILEKSTLLTLNYDWAGKNSDGSDIADRIWLFGHVDCYLGQYRQLIISDNYEANFWYFPTIARWETNMYTQTDKDGINFDHRPPRADFMSYSRRTGGQNIDYVLLLFYRPEFGEHPYSKEIFEQLQVGYQVVYQSPTGRAQLYRRKQQ